MKIKVSNLKKKTFKNCKIPQKLKQEIFLLKDSFWNYGMVSQSKWLNKNVKSHDVHNCLFNKKKLVGYTLLRKRKMFVNNKKHIYFLIDTVTISKKDRKLNIGSYLMNFNNSFVKKNKKIGFLLCKQNLVNFYKKSGWKKLKKNTFRVDVKNSKLNGMTYNFINLKKKQNKNLIYFLTI